MAAVLPTSQQLHGAADNVRLPSLDISLKASLMQHGIFGGHETGQRLAHDFRGLIAECSFRGGIEESNLAGLIGHDDGVQRRLGQLPITPFRFRHGFLGPLPLRDIPEEDLAADDFAQVVINRRLDHLDIHGLPARGLMLFHDFKVLPRFHNGHVIVTILGREIGWKELEVRAPHNLIQGLA